MYGSTARKSRPLTTLRGMLIAIRWDGSPGGMGIAVLTEDEDEFVIDGEQHRERLLEHLEDEVIIWGAVRQGPGDTKLLRVSGFEVVSWDDEDRGDDFDWDDDPLEERFDADQYWL